MPHAAPEQPAPERDQVTPWFWTSFWTVAWKLVVPFIGTLTVDGTTLTEMTVTVKFIGLLASPPTVTTRLPLVAPDGTVTMI